MTVSREPTMDGATVEIIRSYLTSATEQMRRTLVRSAFNPVIYEVLDFGISMYDADLQLIAEAPGITSFLGANDSGIRKGVEYIRPGRLRPGDVVLMNYPYWSGAHAYDALLFAPVFQDDTLAAYVAVRAHWLDLGAKAPGYVLDSTEMHQEGLIFPGTRIVKAGVVDEEIVELVRFNSRLPNTVIGDFYAQLAAIRTGERRLHEIWQKFGLDTVQEAQRLFLDHGERLTRAALARLPDGTWTASDWLDDDGVSDTLIPMQVTITIAGDQMIVDFAGSSGAVPGPVNIPFGATESLGKAVLKGMTTPNEPLTPGTTGR